MTKSNSLDELFKQADDAYDLAVFGTPSPPEDKFVFDHNFGVFGAGRAYSIAISLLQGATSIEAGEWKPDRAAFRQAYLSVINCISVGIEILSKNEGGISDEHIAPTDAIYATLSSGVDCSPYLPHEIYAMNALDCLRRYYDWYIPAFHYESEKRPEVLLESARSMILGHVEIEQALASIQAASVEYFGVPKEKIELLMDGVRKQALSENGRKASDATHRRNREIKEQALKYYEQNYDRLSKNREQAAEEIASTFHRARTTVYKWLQKYDKTKI